MAENKRIAHITENGESDFAVDIEISGFSLKGDEPEDAGGKNLGPSPYDYLLVALGECTAMTIRWYALKQNWPVEHVDVVLTHHKENKKDIFRKEITIKGSELTEEQHQKLVEIAAKCPVQRTLEGSPEISTVEQA